IPYHTLFSQCYGAHRDLHSFPTRRSSDLGGARRVSGSSATTKCPMQIAPARRRELPQSLSISACRRSGECADSGRAEAPETCLRSEEHTSELQSLAYLVCRLLLEKKKN